MKHNPLTIIAVIAMLAIVAIFVITVMLVQNQAAESTGQAATQRGVWMPSPDRSEGISGNTQVGELPGS